MDSTSCPVLCNRCRDPMDPVWDELLILLNAQGDMLLRAKVFMEDTIAAKQHLEAELQEARHEIDRLRRGSGKRSVECQAPEQSLLASESTSKPSLLASKADSVEISANLNVGSLQTGDSPDSLGRPRSYTPTRPLREDGVTHLSRIYLRVRAESKPGKGFHRVIKQGRRALRANHSLLVAEDQFILDDDITFNNAFLVLPSQRYEREKGHPDPTLATTQWNRLYHCKQDVIVNLSSRSYYYLGTFQAVAFVYMTINEIVNLSEKTKDKLYKSSVVNALRERPDFTKENLAAMYARGDLKAVKVRLRRSGFDADLDEALRIRRPKKRSTARETA